MRFSIFLHLFYACITNLSNFVCLRFDKLEIKDSIKYFFFSFPIFSFAQRQTQSGNPNNLQNELFLFGVWIMFVNRIKVFDKFRMADLYYRWAQDVRNNRIILWILIPHYFINISFFHRLSIQILHCRLFI